MTVHLIPMKKFVSHFCGLLAFSVSLGYGQTNQLQLWYNKPATVWEAALPLGNGRLGMMPDGGVDTEHIVLNDVTLWSGSPQDANNYQACTYLPQIRKLLSEGRNDEAQVLVNENFICKGPGSNDGAHVQFGCYQTLGSLDIRFDYGKSSVDSSTISNYKRVLSLSDAIATCTYRANGINYTREYFTSFGSDVSVIRLTADRPGALNFTIALSRSERALVAAKNGELVMEGTLSSGTTNPGMHYLARLKPVLTDGTLEMRGNQLAVRHASAVILYLTAGTSFKNAAFRDSVAAKLARALHTAYTVEKTKHKYYYHVLFNRVRMAIGKPRVITQPTDERMVNYSKQPGNDVGYPVLFYQFGRYLSICSSRVGGVPPNLQGLWANQVQTPWNGDYHLDINVQMNHWPVEVSNLPELSLPLAALVKGMVSNGARTAKAYYQAEGWIAHVITNVWGFTEPGESASWGIAKSGAGWLCSNLWAHYDFTRDERYLADIYPVLKGSAQFYNSTLVRHARTGWMVTSPSSSPENWFVLPNGKTASVCEGPTIDNQMLRELFNNVIAASTILNTDAGLRTQLQNRLKELPPVGRVAKDGRLMEWLEDYKETEEHHRHISNLYGLYPAPEITPDGTPALAEAAKKSLDARGDDGPSWSIAWKQICWARLHDGNRAYQLFTRLIHPTDKTGINYGAGGGVYPNMLSAGPPFQIDGNFGGEAGIAEMLLQSHAGYVELLPALPDAWAATGEVSGLKARGNLTVSFTWENGKVTSYRITSPSIQKARLKVNGVFKVINVQKS